MAEPFLEIHPDDAAAKGIHDADLIAVTNARGSAILRALITDRIAKGTVFAPMHWTSTYAKTGRIDALVEAKTDPFSAQPALKMAQVEIAKFEAKQFIFVASKPKPNLSDDLAYWAIARTSSGWRCEIALSEEVSDFNAFVAGLFDSISQSNVTEYKDNLARRSNIVGADESGIAFALFADRQPVEVARNWVADQLETAETPLAILAGRPPADMPDKGAIVCSCFSVGINEIADAVQGGCHSVEGIGAALKAGTNCGSCRPEIRNVIAQNMPAAAE